MGTIKNPIVNIIERITFGGGAGHIPAVSDLKPALALLKNEGWLFIPREKYFTENIAAECAALEQSYAALPQDPYGYARHRSYLKLKFNLATYELTIPADQSYSQTYGANSLDGGKVRHFAQTSDDLLASPVFQQLVAENLRAMLALYEFEKTEVTIGLHSTRYFAKIGEASFSSPIWLHKDDEPLVFLNVMNESADLVGGDSIISFQKNVINRAVHLAPLEGILLTKNCFHAVTPMAAPRNATQNGYRDILLTTLEEHGGVLKLKTPTGVKGATRLLAPSLVG